MVNARWKTSEPRRHAWLFSVDPAGRIGRRYVTADPFVELDEQGSPIVGYLRFLDLETGEIEDPDGQTVFLVTEARLETWLETGILVDPSGR